MPKRAKVEANTEVADVASVVGPVLWPPDKYEIRFQTKPTQAMITTKVFGGKAYSGVLREDDGTPLLSGCIRLTKDIKTAIVQTSLLADAATAVRDKEVSDVAAAARARQESNVDTELTVVRGEDGKDKQAKTDEALAAEVAKAEADAKKSKKKNLKLLKRNSTESSEPNFLDEMIGSARIDSPAKPRAIAKNPGSGSRRGGGARGVPAGDANANTGAPEPDKIPPPSKRNNSLGWQFEQNKRRKTAAAEVTILKGEQFVQLFGDNDGAYSLTLDSLKKVEDDVEKQIDKIIDVAQGLEVMDKLSELQRNLRLIHDVVESLPLRQPAGGKPTNRKKEKAGDEGDGDDDDVSCEPAVVIMRIAAAQSAGLTVSLVFFRRLFTLATEKCVEDHDLEGLLYMADKELRPSRIPSLSKSYLWTPRMPKHFTSKTPRTRSPL